LAGYLGAGGLSGALGSGGLSGALGSGGLAGALGSGGLSGALGSGGLSGFIGPGGLASVLGSGGMAGALGSGGLSGVLGFGGLSGVLGNGTLLGQLEGGGLAGALGSGGLSGFFGPSGLAGALGSGGLASFLGVGGLAAVLGQGELGGYLGSSGLAGYLGSGGLASYLGSGGLAGTLGGGGLAGFFGPAGLAGALGSGGLASLLGSSGLAGVLGNGTLASALGSGGLSGVLGLGGLNSYLSTGGLAGVFGPAGLASVLGSGGFAGVLGPSGLAGALGSGGLAGFLGPGGLSGTLGSAGLAGALGSGGLAGLLGTGDLSGYVGAGGLSGVLGSSGLAGVLGSAGLAGFLGSNGLAAIYGTGGLSAFFGPGGVAGFLAAGGLSALLGSGGATGFLGSTDLSSLLGTGSSFSASNSGSSSGTLGTTGATATTDSNGGGGTGSTGSTSGINNLLSPADITAFTGSSTGTLTPDQVNQVVAVALGEAVVATALIDVAISSGLLTTLSTVPTAATATVNSALTITAAGTTVAVVPSATLSTTLVGAILSTPAFQKAVLSNPGVLQSFFSTPAVFQALMTNSSLEAQASSNPVSLVTFLNNQTIQTQLASPAEQSFVTAQVQAANPLVTNALLVANPTNLSSPVVQSIVQKFLATSGSGQLSMNVTLSGSGNEAVGGLFSNFTLGPNSLFTESISAAQLAVLNQAITNGTTNLTSFLGSVTATGGNNVFVGGVGANFTALGGGSNHFVIEDPSQLGLSGSAVPSQLYNYGGTFTGSGGNDTFYFSGGGNGYNFGNVTLNDPYNPQATQALDFSNFQGGGVTLDLSKSGTPQQVASGLKLRVPGGITNVIGSPGNDSITGNNLNDTIQGSAVDAPDPYALPAQPPASPKTQWVYLDFTDFTAPPAQYASENVTFTAHGAQPTMTANSSLTGVGAAINVATSTTGNATTSAVQAITFLGTNLGGTFTLTYTDSQGHTDTTQSIPWSNDPATLARSIQSALSLISTSVASAPVTISESLHNLTGTYTSGPALSGTVTSGSNVITLGSAAGLSVGEAVSGAGITAGTTIATIPSGTSITLSAPVTLPGGAQSATETVGFGDQNAILQRLQQIYAPFNTSSFQLINFTLNPSAIPAGAPYETVYFDEAPIGSDGKPFSGGESDEIDFRNLNQNTAMQVDVNGVLGVGLGQVTDSDANWINLSATITAHELGHTLGLRHEDAFGPLGFGISNPPGPGAYIPVYPGLVGAFTTDDHIITSPAAVGSTLLDAANPNDYFGEREAVKLAFISDGTVVEGTNTAGNDGPWAVTPTAANFSTTSLYLQNEMSGGTISAAPLAVTPSIPVQSVSLYTLNVPNTVPSGFDAGQTLDVAAVDVLGHLGNAQGVVTSPDFYTFKGSAGDLMNIQVLSNGLTRLVNSNNWIDPVVYVYGPNGKLVAWDDDQFEGPDSSIVDLTLPTTGTYTVEVDSYPHATGQSATGQPGTAGDYELFMYRALNYNATSTTNGGTDTLIAGTGNDTLIGGSSNTKFVLNSAAPEKDTVIGGQGAFNTVTDSSSIITLTGQSGTTPPQLTTTSGVISDTSTLSNIAAITLVDTSTGGNNTFQIDPSWTAPVTIDAAANDSVTTTGPNGALNAPSVVINVAPSSQPWAVSADGTVTSTFSPTGNLANFKVTGAIPSTTTVTVNGGVTNMTVGPNTYKLGDDLAGSLTVTGALSQLQVAGGTPGIISAASVGTISVLGGYGPMILQVNDGNVERHIEAAAVTGNPYPSMAVAAVQSTTAATASPSGALFQYVYQGTASTKSATAAQATVHVLNPAASPDQYDLSLVTDPLASPAQTANVDAAQFNLVRLDTPTYSLTGTTTKGSPTVTLTGIPSGLAVGQVVSGAGIPAGTTITAITNTTSATSITLSSAATATNGKIPLTATALSGIRNVAVEGSLVPTTAYGGIAVALPSDNLAGVAARDYAPNASIQAASLQAVAFGTYTQPNGQIGSGATANPPNAAALLVSGTQIVPATDSLGKTDTYRVPFGDINTVGLFIVTNKNGGGFDPNNIAFVVQDTSANGTIEDYATRGSVTALVTVLPTYDAKGNMQGPDLMSIALMGDGGSIATNQQMAPAVTTSGSTSQTIPSITSTGPLGNVTLQGPMSTNITAPSIFGSIPVNGPFSSTFTTTGVRIDPITQLQTVDPNNGNFGTAGGTFNATGPVSGGLVVAGDLASNTTFGGPMNAGSQIVVKPNPYGQGGNVEGGLTVNGPINAGSTISITGNVGGLMTVVDPPGTTEIVTFPFAGPQPLITANVNGLKGTKPTITFTNTTNSPIGAFPNTTATQTLTFGGTITGGTFTLTADGITTGPIAWSPNPATLATNIQAALNSPTLTLGGPLNGKVSIGGTVYDNVQINGPLNAGGSFTVGGNIGAPGDPATFTLGGPLGGLFTTQGTIYDNTQINGPLQGGQMEVGDNVVGNLNIGGPINAGSGVVIVGNLGTTGSATTLTVGGPVSGQLIVLNDNPTNSSAMNPGSIQINGPVQKGGVVAIQGAVTGSLGITGPIDSASSVVAGNSLSGVTLGGPVQGILAAVGNITYAPAPPQPNTKGAVYYAAANTTNPQISSANVSQINGTNPPGIFPTLDSSLASLTSKTLSVGYNATTHLLTFALTTPTHNLSASGESSNGTFAYTPAQVRTAYGINNLSYDGTGQTIAVVEAYDDPNILDAVDAFDSQFGLTADGQTLYQQYGPASAFVTVLNQSGQTDNLPAADPSGGWEEEEALDVEWAHALAPGARIVVVGANSQSLADLMASVVTAANQPGVSVVSMSWGFTEGQTILAQDEAAYDGDFTTPAGHTPATFVASTGDYGTADPEYPAYSPNVVAVGGTSLYLNSDNSYNSETGWGYYSGVVGAFIGSGGGVSRYEPEPAYQSGVQSGGNRTTPDVSFLADPNTGAWMADTYNLPGDDPFTVVGGTSLSAPSWSGLVALVDQGRAAAGEATLSSNGGNQIQQALYTLPAGDFNSITSGTNGAYSAAAGYNLVTGLGTPVVNLLVPDLVAYQQTSPTNVTVQAPGGPSGAGNGSINVFNVFNVLGGASRAADDSAPFLAVHSGLHVPASREIAPAPDLGRAADAAPATPTASPAGTVLRSTPTIDPTPAGEGGAVARALTSAGPNAFGWAAAEGTIVTGAGATGGSVLLVNPGVLPGYDGGAGPRALMPAGLFQGSSGGDLLIGGDGSDLLVGGEGQDMLVGGFGSDHAGAGPTAIPGSTMALSDAVFAAGSPDAASAAGISWLFGNDSGGGANNDAGDTQN
jgi:hypothetical protein